MKFKQATIKQLRIFGFGLTIFLIAIALIRFLHQHEQSAFVLWGIAGVIFIINIFFPKFIKPVYQAAMFIAGILGWINTRILLSIFFYLLFTPISIILKIFRADPLHRKLMKEASSYWKPHSDKPTVKERYFQQF